MQTREVQNGAPGNPAAARQGKCTARVSEGVAGFEAMADNGPQARRTAQLAALANASPAMAWQHGLAGMIENSPRMAAQRKFIDGINKSPHVSAQRRQFDSLFGAGQRRAEETPSGKFFASRGTKNGPPPQGMFAAQATAETAARQGAVVSFRLLNPGAPSSRFPVQRIRAIKEKSGLDETLREELNKSINRIVIAAKKPKPTESDIHLQMAQLDELEHKVYDWFRENHSTGDSGQLHAMFDLLDDIKDHHRMLIKRTIDTGSSLWVKDKLDVPGRKKVNELWDALVSGQGNFEMPTNVHTANGQVNLPDNLQKKFKVDTLAAMARLMSRPKGRSLVKALHEGSADGKEVNFMIPPIHKLRGTDGYATRYVGAKAQAYSDGDAAVKLRGTKKHNHRLVKGTGSGSGVLIAPGVKDSSMVDFDRAQNPILSPSFIGVGHELIHAAHYQRGSYLASNKGSGAKLPAYGDDVEEFLTIASPKEHQGLKVAASLGQLAGGSATHKFDVKHLANLNAGIPTEAEIRAEHGLAIRHGHTSMANPIRYSKATPQEDPGTHVSDAVDWLGNFGAPRPQPQVRVPQQANAVAPAATTGWWGSLTSGLSSMRQSVFGW